MAEKPVFPDDQVVQTSLGKETVFTDNGIVSRTLLNNPVTRVVLFAFAAGQSLSEHSTPRAAFILILSGTCEFDVDGKTRILVAGDLLHMPPGTPHAVRVGSSCSFLLTLSKV